MFIQKDRYIFKNKLERKCRNCFLRYTDQKFEKLFAHANLPLKAAVTNISCLAYVLAI